MKNQPQQKGQINFIPRSITHYPSSKFMNFYFPDKRLANSGFKFTNSKAEYIVGEGGNLIRLDKIRIKN